MGRRGGADGAAELGGGAAGRLAGREPDAGVAPGARAGDPPPAGLDHRPQAGRGGIRRGLGGPPRPHQGTPRLQVLLRSQPVDLVQAGADPLQAAARRPGPARGHRPAAGGRAGRGAVLPRERIRRGGQPPRLGHDRRSSGLDVARGAAPAGGGDRRRGRRGALGGDHPQGPQAEQRVHAAGVRRPLAPDAGGLRHRRGGRPLAVGAAGDHGRRLHPVVAGAGLEPHRHANVPAARGQPGAAGDRAGGRLRAGRPAVPDGRRRLRPAAGARLGTAAGGVPWHGLKWQWAVLPVSEKATGKMPVPRTRGRRCSVRAAASDGPRPALA